MVWSCCAGSVVFKKAMEMCQSGRLGLPAKELSVHADRRFKSCHLRHAPVAQRIEHLTTDQKVGGSNPSGRTKEISRYCLDQTSGVARFFFPLPFGAVPFCKLSKLNCWNRRVLAVDGRFSALFQQFSSSSLWLGRAGERPGAAAVGHTRQKCYLNYCRTACVRLCCR